MIIIPIYNCTKFNSVIMIPIQKYDTKIKMISFVFYFIIMLTFNLRLINAECDLQKEQFNINDQQINQIIMEEKVDSAVTYKSHSVTGIQLVEIDKTTDLASFFHFSVAENDTGSYLVTKTTENFGDFAKFAYSPNGVSIAILIITLSLSCGENPIVFNIVDSLSHLPEFSKGSYTFSLPMPILTSYQITFEDEIEVTEINFSNTGMSFATEPDDFNVITHQSSSSRKKFLAYLVAKNALQFDSKEYQLTATNTAGRTTSVTLTITADEVSSFDTPIFSNSAYRFNLITTNNENSLIPLDDDAPITVESNKLNTSFWFIEGDYKDYFTIEFANETGEFNVGLSADKILPRDLSDNQIFLILTFISDSSTNCIILVDILKIIPQFSNSFYSGVYNSDEEELIINWENEIMVSNAIKVSLPDNFLEIFEITNDTQERYLITPRRPLVDEDFSFGSDIIFNIFAVSNTTDVAEATIVISQQKSQIKMFQFDKVFYRATYSNDNVTLEDHLGFLNIESADKITIEVDDDKYKERFKLELGETDDEWKIYAIKKLDDLFLNSNSELAITITATKNSNEISNAVLILNIPDTVVVKFDALFYQGSYKIDEENNTAFESPSIKITGVNSEDINIFVEDYTDYFQTQYDPEKLAYKIILQKKFDDEDLKLPELYLTLKAVTKGGITNSSILIIEFPTNSSSPSTFWFSNFHYTGKYSINSNDAGEIKLLDGPISIENPDKLFIINFTLEGYEENFELKPTGDDVYELQILKKLDNDTLLKFPLALTITALTSTNISASTVLVLDLNTTTSNLTIKFEKEHYIANYTVHSNGTSSIELVEGRIKLEKYFDFSEVTFSFEDDIENFEIKHDEDAEDDAYFIDIAVPLEQKVLDAKDQIILTLHANTPEEAATYSVLVINILKSANLVKFAKNCYIANYKTGEKDASIKLDDDEFISLDIIGNFDTPFSFSIEDYNENFEIVPDLKDANKNSYSVRVNSPLSDTTLKKFEQILTKITISNVQSFGEDVTTVLLIKLPSYTYNIFEESYYKAEYVLDRSLAAKDKIILVDTVRIKDNKFGLLSVEGFDEFTGSCDAASFECNLELSQNLNASTISDKKEIVTALVATTEDKYKRAIATFIIKLPDENSTFKFEKPYYSAVYNIQKSEDDFADLVLNEDISFEGVNNASDVVLVSDEYPNYIELIQNSSNWKINVLKNFEAELLANKSELVSAITASGSRGITKTVFAIKLPTISTVKFLQQQYFCQYSIENSSAIIENEVEIQSTFFEGSEIVLSGFSEFFIINAIKGSWKTELVNPLNFTVLTEYSELTIEMTLTKIGLKFGSALLIIRLPSPNFSQAKYTAFYKADKENSSLTLNEDIHINNVDSDYLYLIVTDYSEYLEVNFNKENATWTVHLIQPFSSAIQGPVVTNIEALKKSDNTILATSTLVISLSTDNDNNVTEKPQFSKIFYSGEYKSSDPPSLEINDTIELISNGIDATIYIDPDEYSSYFHLEQQSNVCNISLNESLGREILDTHTNIVLTLMANSSQNSKGYALLVISLPKSTRNNSIEVENKEILFSASFENGIFSSPIIPLHFSNVTSIDNIKVDITNGENVDIFKYHLNGTLLYLEMDKVADDYLDNFSIIPLKLAITDKSTSDKIFVVVNVRINPSSNNREPDSPNNTSVLGLIIATSVLGVLLILTILAAIAYWYFKIRKAGYVEMETIESIEENPYFIKREPKEIEKPTELDIDIISTVSNGQAKVENMHESASPEFGRKVTFNEKVKQIDNNNMEDAESPSYEFQSVATRRPTKFVFSPYNETEAEDVSKSESSDNLDELVVDELRRRNNSLENEGENKKSVVFNENIEKMHIEPPDENDGESEEDNEDDSAKKNNLTADTDEDESPASIFKEVIAEIEMKISKEK